MSRPRGKVGPPAAADMKRLGLDPKRINFLWIDPIVEFAFRWPQRGEPDGFC
jgi:hypothetical protein